MRPGRQARSVSPSDERCRLREVVGSDTALTSVSKEKALFSWSKSSLRSPSRCRFRGYAILPRSQCLLMVGPSPGKNILSLGSTRRSSDRLKAGEAFRSVGLAHAVLAYGPERFARL